MGLFDGTHAPKFQVEFAWGGSATVDPQAGYFILGTSQLDTGQLGSIGWQLIPAEDIVSMGWRRGQNSELDQASPGSATIVLDNVSGIYDPLNLQSPYMVAALQYFHLDQSQLNTGLLGFTADTGTPIVVGVPVRIVAVITDPTTGADVQYPQFRGVVSAMDPDYGLQSTITFQCLDGLDLLGHRKLSTVAPVNDNDLTGTRLGRILDAVAWPTSLRSIDAGQSRCTTMVLGDFALPLAQQIVDTELGNMFVNGSGTLCFFDRLHPYTQTRSTSVQAVFTDDSSSVDYVQILFGESTDIMYNEARLTRTGGTEQTFTDTTYAAQYGTRTFPNQAGSQLRTDSDALSLAGWIVGRFKKPLMRVQSIQVEALPLGQWATLLRLELLDRIRVIRSYGVNTAGGYANTIDRQVFIQGFAVSVTQNSWSISYTTSMADLFSPFLLDTSKLDSGTPV